MPNNQQRAAAQRVIDEYDPLEVAIGKQLDALGELAKIGPRWDGVFSATSPECGAEYRKRMKCLIRRRGPKSAIGLVQ